MKNTMLTLAAAAALSAAADPTDPQVAISSVTQPAGKYQVTVSYTLDEDAVVTMDVKTNGVSIGGQNINHVVGDCFKLVKSGTGTFTWYADKSWPGHRIDENIVTVEVKAWAKIAPPDFMAIDLMGNFVNYYPSKEFLPGGITDDIYKTSKLLMRKIHSKGVEWTMGSPVTECGREQNRQSIGGGSPGYAPEVAHTVTLDHDFYIAVYELTFRQDDLIKDTMVGGYFNQLDWRSTRPADYSCYPEGLRIINKLAAKTGMTGFKLPLEAEWEFACRAGSTAALYSGKELTTVSTSSGQPMATNADANLDELARYGYNGGMTDADGNVLTVDYTWSPEHGTAKVGSYKPNAFDLYDMLGNVREITRSVWAFDCSSVDPNAEQDVGSNNIVMRGGSWHDTANWCRSASRASWGSSDWPSWNQMYQGVRLSCTAVAEK